MQKHFPARRKPPTCHPLPGPHHTGILGAVHTQNGTGGGGASWGIFLLSPTGKRSPEPTGGEKSRAAQLPEPRFRAETQPGVRGTEKAMPVRQVSSSEEERQPLALWEPLAPGRRTVLSLLLRPGAGPGFRGDGLGLVWLQIPFLAAAPPDDAQGTVSGGCDERCGARAAGILNLTPLSSPFFTPRTCLCWRP